MIRRTLSRQQTSTFRSSSVRPGPCGFRRAPAPGRLGVGFGSTLNKILCTLYLIYAPDIDLSPNAHARAPLATRGALPGALPGVSPVLHMRRVLSVRTLGPSPTLPSACGDTTHIRVFAWVLPPSTVCSCKRHSSLEIPPPGAPPSYPRSSMVIARSHHNITNKVQPTMIHNRVAQSAPHHVHLAY